LDPGTPEVLFNVFTNPNRGYAVGAGGDQFLLPQPLQDNPGIAIVQNWLAPFEEQE